MRCGFVEFIMIVALFSCCPFHTRTDAMQSLKDVVLAVWAESGVSKPADFQDEIRNGSEDSPAPMHVSSPTSSLPPPSLPPVSSPPPPQELPQKVDALKIDDEAEDGDTHVKEPANVGNKSVLE